MGRSGLALAATSALVVGLLAGAPTRASPTQVASEVRRTPEVSTAVAHDTSVPLRSLSPPRTKSKGFRRTPNFPVPTDKGAKTTPAKSSAQQHKADQPSGAPMPSPDQNFAGIDKINYPEYSFPPDTNGDVGPDHYVQIVNMSFAVYSKTGTLLGGPWDNNTIWSGFGGDCETYNDGDPIIQYDQLADRWLISQLAYEGSTYYECLAVSTTGDPTGAYNRYAFSYDELNDYPKIGIWPDGYYVTYNMYNGATFTGFEVCALERSAMLDGDTATQQCFDLPEEYSLLPSDLDGGNPPPSGSPNYILGEHWSDNTKLTMYKFSVDWDTPGNTTLTGPTYITVDEYTWACVGVTRGRCIPQPDTDVKLEVIGGRMMYRLAYRNFGTHESLVTNHTVAMDGTTGYTTQTGVGWYEIRDPDADAPTVYQDGIFDPDDTDYRWMGSIARDNGGNMALGYSKSNDSTTYPSIYYAGRLAADPLSTLPQSEVSIIDGSGSQTGSTRWGDYSAMQIDPDDDCTFWYTNEYLTTTGEVPWSTRIASFKYPDCTPTGPALAPTFDDPTSTADGFTAQVSNYNAAYTWDATVTSGAVAIDGSGLVTVTGLDPGESATATVTTNRTGYYEGSGDVDGSASAVVPGAPTGVSAVAGKSKATVSWTAPASTGGSALSGYRIQRRAGSGSWSTVVTNTGSTTTSRVISGLTGGTSYQFRVAAINTVGVGSYSSASSAVTPYSAPGRPGKPDVTPKKYGKAFIEWARSAANGATVTYKLFKSKTNDGDGKQFATTTKKSWSGEVPGAKKGKALFFTIVPRNAAGNGPDSKITKARMK